MRSFPAVKGVRVTFPFWDVAAPAKVMELTESEMLPRAAVMVEPVVNDGAEIVIPPTAEVFTAPARLAEVPAETFRVEAVIAWVLRVVAAVKKVDQVVNTAPPIVAPAELFSVNVPA